MWNFNPTKYGPQLAELLQMEQPAPLGPGQPRTSLQEPLETLTPDSFATQGTNSGRRVHDPDMARCCLAGIWLLHGFLQRSHEISQQVDSTSGSYWHAIMHRREPDYSNSKYWFRRVGRHPIFPSLREATAGLASSSSDAAPYLALSDPWDASRFVDLCQAVALGRVGDEMLVRQVAQVEWQMLFDYCFRAANGAGDAAP